MTHPASTEERAPEHVAEARAVRSMEPTVAELIKPVLAQLVRPDLPIRFAFWDGSEHGPPDVVATLRIASPDALRRMLWMPNELGVGRAYVAGDLELEGDAFAAVAALRDRGEASLPALVRQAPAVVSAARRLGVLGGPVPPPPEEAHLSWRDGIRHSVGRDSKAISHHYDVGNDFYRLVLGPSMTYSCARFVEPADTLEEAQAAKHELVCRKLGLHERHGARLLDVGCGWGSMAIHAARHHGARVVGVTISKEQADLARRRADEAGVAGQIEIRLQDYRDLHGESFDVISSIGMSEHVGHRRIDQYFTTLRSLLGPGGRLLNHAISSVGGSRLRRSSFIGRYVFPDGELIDAGDVVLAMEAAGFEVRDVESLREHYALTLRQWVANLERNWDRAVELVGAPRARVWRLYMAGSAVGFEDGGIAIHQVLGTVRSESGSSGMPLTRRAWD